ncbi:hypothetical protein SELMODRAFT_446742 [Selaginella moellendorffii]|uniref:Exocyst complex component Sec3 PIP2-binding N-terminal domain-containing protein n=1 Tax=Selaginella moellendorffii TaxID=88036 RepID=D8STZ6_SELML|nr:hypothetical protein SELMODRAFT_446742 [Selaginella moellendorffii]
MVKALTEEEKLHKLVEAVFQDSDNDVTVAFKVTKSQSAWGALSRSTSKPRVLAIACKRSPTTQKFKVTLHVLKYSSSGFQARIVVRAKLYKMKHLSRVEVVPSDSTGCTFVLGFDNLKIQNVAPPQWTMRNVDERNRFLTTVIRLCKENLGRIPKIVGMDVVEMALWEQAHSDTAATPSGTVTTDGVDQTDLKVTVERELVSKAEEDDMEALLGTYVMGLDEAEAFSERLKRELLALEAANVHAILESDPLVEEVLRRLNNASEAVEDMDEWLGIFNVKLRHMREDIESIESRNNMLEMQVQNNAALVAELNKLLERLHVPPQYATLLTSGAFDESRMPQNVDACDWLAGAIRGMEPPLMDPAYANMRAVKDKRGELEKLKSTFVRRASEFLRSYFSNLVDFMISDKTYFSQRGQLKRPDHADLRFKCRTYARLLQHLKGLDKNSLGPLRKAYCQSLNLLLRREAREFANELRASTKVLRSSAVWMDNAVAGGGTAGSMGDTSTVSDAYAKMLRIFVPLLVDESAFFASFMCYEVLPLAPPRAGDEKSGDDEDDTPLDFDGADAKPTEQNAAEMEALNQALQELLDGIQEDFYAVVDWAYKVDPLRCISMQGTTERYLSSHKADAAGFVRRLLADLQARISNQFSKFLDEVCHQIEKHDRNVRQTGVLSYVPRFASLASRMEGLVQGMSRDMVDLAYTRLVGTMFTVLERIAQNDPKYADVLLLENYASFQNSMFDLANMVPTLARFYQQASEAYEQACTRYVNSIINMQFEKLFQFGQRVENLLYTITPEEVPFQLGVSKNELRKVVKASLSGVERSLQAMYKKMQKTLVSEELLPNLWDKCKVDFIDKYESLEALLQKCYPSETLSPSSTEMKELFKTV